MSGLAVPAAATTTNTNTELAIFGTTVIADGKVAFLVDEADQGGISLNGDWDATDVVLHVLDPATGVTVNTGLAASVSPVAVGRRFAFAVSEAMQGGTDLNGDTDATDEVFHVYDPVTGVMTNTGLTGFVEPVAVGNKVALMVIEADHGGDLNGDGDTSDEVLHIYDPITGAVTNVGLGLPYGGFGTPVAIGEVVAFIVSEPDQSQGDLNGDTDELDAVLHLFDISTGVTTNTALAGGFNVYVTDGSFAYPVSEAAHGQGDLSGDSDTTDSVLHFVDPATGTSLSTGRATTSAPTGAAGKAFFTVSELEQGNSDLNGDSDALDQVMHSIDLTTGVVTNVGVHWNASTVVVIGGRIVFIVSEWSQGGVDLNGDSDAYDWVIHVLDVSSGVRTNLAIAGYPALDAGGRVAITVDESDHFNTDLNGDGDTDEWALQLLDPATGVATSLAISGYQPVLVNGKLLTRVDEYREGGTDLNGDGDANDSVLHLVDLDSDTVINLGLAGGGSSVVDDSTVAYVSSEPYLASDLNADGDTSDAVLQVLYLNRAPLASGDTYSVTAGQTLVVNGVLGNDSDPDGDPLGAEFVAGPTNGTLDLASDGSFTYDPDTGFVGDDSFTYRADDGEDVSPVVVVDITVNAAPPPNGAPVAVGDSYSVTAGQTLVVNGVLGNDSDPDGDPLVAQLVADPTNGTLVLDPDGSFTYDPDTGFVGDDSFTYRADDGEDVSPDVVVDITVQSAAGPDPFVDDDGSVFEADIEWLANAGITRGCNPPTNDQFCPNQVVTRGQFAALLRRALGLTDQLDDPFIDDDGSVFEADIERLAAAGITRGCNPPTNNRFCPDQAMTRGQMAALLVRALSLTDRLNDPFVDDDGSVFEADIERLAAAGITRGCNPPINDRFCPNDAVTRAHMAAFLRRAFG